MLTGRQSELMCLKHGNLWGNALGSVRYSGSDSEPKPNTQATSVQFHCPEVMAIQLHSSHHAKLGPTSSPDDGLRNGSRSRPVAGLADVAHEAHQEAAPRTTRSVTRKPHALPALIVDHRFSRGLRSIYRVMLASVFCLQVSTELMNLTCT